MTTAQVDKLWVCFRQIARDDEKKTAICSTVGLQCAGRKLADFQRDLASGVRDGFVFYKDHVVIVRTPPNPGLGSVVKILLRGTGSVVPHSRLPRSAFSGIEIASGPPPGWNLLRDFRFLHAQTAQGELWYWIDDDSMTGKETYLERAVGLYNADIGLEAFESFP
jgi:hypothetical protein